MKAMLAGPGTPKAATPTKSRTAPARSPLKPVVDDSMSVFLRLEMQRAELERELGEVKFTQAYTLLQEMQEEEVSGLHIALAVEVVDGGEVGRGGIGRAQHAAARGPGGGASPGGGC